MVLRVEFLQNPINITAIAISHFILKISAVEVFTNSIFEYANQMDLVRLHTMSIQSFSFAFDSSCLFLKGTCYAYKFLILLTLLKEVLNT